jgi:hypothetical protein
MVRRIAFIAALVMPGAVRLAAQAPPAIAAERSAYEAWLTAAPTSPFAAVAQQPIGDGLTLGTDGDLPLEAVDARIRIDAGRVLLEDGGRRSVLPRHRPTRLGRYHVVPGGTAAKPMLTVFDSAEARKSPRWFAYDPALEFIGRLTPPERPATRRLLAPDGIEVEATEAGTVLVPMGGGATRLTVMRIPDPSTGESELEIFFRDGTNAKGTYPAGRFVSLVPLGDGRYRLDFNRARNPFCAYSTAYACPLPWQGNVLPAPVRAGEQYVTE